MANKFYVGQRVRVVGNAAFSKNPVGTIGTVEELDGISCRVRPDGHIGSTVGFRSYLDELSPIDPPRTILADWQRNRLENVFDVIDSIGKTAFADVIEQALNQPEPPKYKPKHGEAVQLRDNDSDMWLVDVFYEMTDDGIYKGYNMLGKFCRPFDAALVGKVTND